MKNFPDGLRLVRIFCIFWGLSGRRIFWNMGSGWRLGDHLMYRPIKIGDNSLVINGTDPSKNVDQSAQKRDKATNNGYYFFIKFPFLLKNNLAAPKSELQGIICDRWWRLVWAPTQFSSSLPPIILKCITFTSFDSSRHLIPKRKIRL